MSGSIIGGKKAATKNLARDPDHYKRIGAIGGKRGVTGGFASNLVGEDGLTGRERAIISGAKGGQVSRRGPSRIREQPVEERTNWFAKLIKG